MGRSLLGRLAREPRSVRRPTARGSTLLGSAVGAAKLLYQCEALRRRRSSDVIGRDLHVTIRGPEVPRDIEQRLAVRVVEALRSGRRAFSKKTVSYEIIAAT